MDESMSHYFPIVWGNLLVEIMSNGQPSAPRGQPIKELMSKQIVVDMRRPVLNTAARKLSYRFMAAEAYWILSGDDRVETIAPYNPNIRKFSDDGVRFFGAYGPPIRDQLGFVVNKIEKDLDTRQAGLTIWRQNPPKTKDVPCTVAIFFNVRKDLLNAHVFMRSSDAWLGVPYDVFNFSMLAHLVCAHLNSRARIPTVLRPGLLYLTAASSHLYETNWAAVDELTRSAQILQQPITPSDLYVDPNMAMIRLGMLKDSKPGDSVRWWS